jgi:prepilin-type N-terminal cleavage/methylation domain-containing protein
LSSARTSSKRRRGFTLIEVVVATALLAIGIAMGSGALSAMTRTELRVRETEKMNLLAVQKLQELTAYGNINNAQTEGDFEDFGEPNYKWSLEVAPSGTQNVDTVRLTVEAASGDTTSPSAEVSTLVFTSPNAQSGALGS